MLGSRIFVNMLKIALERHLRPSLVEQTACKDYIKNALRHMLGSNRCLFAQQSSIDMEIAAAIWPAEL